MTGNEKGIDVDTNNYQLPGNRLPTIPRAIATPSSGRTEPGLASGLTEPVQRPSEDLLGAQVSAAGAQPAVGRDEPGRPVNFS